MCPFSFLFRLNTRGIQTVRRKTAFAHLWDLKSTHYLPQFMVSPKNGFLPREDPLTKLPAKYSALEDLLNRMPKILADGTPGLLSIGKFGEAAENLPEYDLSDVNDTRLDLALFRDYTFVTSSYLLEPCDIRLREGKKYGPGRKILPRNIAVPLSRISKKLGSRPFMEYAQSYVLSNYKRKNPNGLLDYDNLSLIRTVSGHPSEHGFILTLVAMVRYSGDLVRATIAALEAVGDQDRKRFETELDSLTATMINIITVMETMWEVSAPKHYNTFRTFIMGIKNQEEIFPEGVIYEGVSEIPVFYRGESGASDSIVPTMDNLLQLTERMPSNELTDILRDFRTYRPEDHSRWLTWTETTAKSLGVCKFVLKDPVSTLKYLGLMDQVRDFRYRHWKFVQKYIRMYSDHPVATGGSPIKTWLPNQLTTVLDTITEFGEHTLSAFPNADGNVKAEISNLIARARSCIPH